MQASNMPSKRPRIVFLLDEELRADLEEWAQQESRTLSNLCELIVRKAVEERKALQQVKYKEDNDQQK